MGLLVFLFLDILNLVGDTRVDHRLLDTSARDEGHRDGVDGYGLSVGRPVCGHPRQGDEDEDEDGCEGDWKGTVGVRRSPCARFMEKQVLTCG